MLEFIRPMFFLFVADKISLKNGGNYVKINKNENEQNYLLKIKRKMSFGSIFR